VKPADEAAATTPFQVPAPPPEALLSPHASGEPAEPETVEAAVQRAYQSTKGQVEWIFQPKPELDPENETGG
jgi:hypothetical protein